MLGREGYRSPNPADLPRVRQAERVVGTGREVLHLSKHGERVSDQNILKYTGVHTTLPNTQSNLNQKVQKYIQNHQ